MLKNSCSSVLNDLNVSENIYTYEQCQNQAITDLQIVGPAGITISSIVLIEAFNGNYSLWRSTLTWMPSSKHKGSNLACIKAKSSSKLASDLFCLNIYVGVNNVSSPKVIQAQPNGTIFITKFQTFEIEFSLNIKRPQRTAFLTFRNALTDEECFKIDTSMLDEHLNFKMNKLVFNLSRDHFESVKYYVLFDYGVALSASDECSSISDKMDDKLFWYFEVSKINDSVTTPSTFNVSHVNLANYLIHEYSTECNKASLFLIELITAIGLFTMHMVILILYLKYVFTQNC